MKDTPLSNPASGGGGYGGILSFPPPHFAQGRVRVGAQGIMFSG